MNFNHSRVIVIISVIIILAIALPVNAVTYTYDSNNRMLSANYGEGQVYYYQYDAVGNLRGITEGLQLELLSTTPEDEAVGISVYENISAVFNTTIILASQISDSKNESVGEFVYNPIKVSPARILDENNLEVSCSANVNNNVLSIVPSMPLDIGKTYRVVIPASLITSSQHTGVSLASDYEFSFTTVSSNRTKGAVQL